MQVYALTAAHDDFPGKLRTQAASRAIALDSLAGAFYSYYSAEFSSRGSPEVVGIGQSPEKNERFLTVVRKRLVASNGKLAVSYAAEMVVQ